jgi:hypothetical protein
MNFNPGAKRSLMAGSILALLAFINFSGTARAQTVYVVDQFNPAGTGGNSHSGGQIGTSGTTGLVVRFNPWSGIQPATPAIIPAPAP